MRLNGQEAALGIAVTTSQINYYPVSDAGLVDIQGLIEGGQLQPAPVTEPRHPLSLAHPNRGNYSQSQADPI